MFISHMEEKYVCMSSMKIYCQISGQRVSTELQKSQLNLKGCNSIFPCQMQCICMYIHIRVDWTRRSGWIPVNLLIEYLIYDI